jgi:ABC-type hemin transport system ATPase subunit
LFDPIIDFLAGKRNTARNTPLWKLSIEAQLQGKLTMVVGEVGNGKTALLSALLGELTGSKRSTQDPISLVT